MIRQLLVLICLVGSLEANWSGAISLSGGTAGAGAVFASNALSQSVVVWVEGGNLLRANVQTAPGVWSASADIVTSSLNGISEPAVAINAAGLIVLAWKEGSGATAQIYSSSRTVASPIWAPKVLLSNAIVENHVDYPNVSINATGLAFVTWQSQFAPNYLIRAARANPPPAFTAAQTVFSGLSPLLYPKVAVGDTGSTEEAHLIYGSGSTLFATIFDGAVWSAVPAAISTGTVELGSDHQSLGLDESGQAVAVWSLLASPGIHTIAGNVYSGAWGVAAQLSGNSLQLMVPTLHISPSGDGILAWEIENASSSFAKQARILVAGASSFGPINTLAVYSANSGRPLAFANEGGEAIASWLTPTSSLVAAVYPITPGAWNRFQTISSPVLSNIGISLSNDDLGTGVFQRSPDGAIFAATGADLFELFPLPPSNLRGKKNVETRFLVQSIYANILFWEASPTSAVVTYTVLRNGVQIGSVDATAPLQFTDQRVDRYRQYIYSVVAVDDAGLQSEPITLIL